MPSYAAHFDPVGAVRSSLYGIQLGRNNVLSIGAPVVLTDRGPYYQVGGGNFTFNYRCCLQFNDLYVYGHDYNPLPGCVHYEPDYWVPDGHQLFPTNTLVLGFEFAC